MGCEWRLSLQFLSTFGYCAGRKKIRNCLLIDWERFRVDGRVAQGPRGLPKLKICGAEKGFRQSNELGHWPESDQRGTTERWDWAAKWPCCLRSYNAREVGWMKDWYRPQQQPLAFYVRNFPQNPSQQSL